jgi:hypothetical protein
MFEFAGTAFVLAKEAYEYLKGAKEVFDAGKGALDAAKDIKEHFEIKEGEPKLVDFEWTRKSGFQEQAEAQGYKIAFSRPDKIASREIDGYEVMYEIDKGAKTKRRLVLRDGLTLIGKKS